MSKIIRITKTVRDFGLLVGDDELYQYVDSSAPYFRSLYYYPEDALDYYNANRGSVRGYKGSVSTNEIWFDIDSKDLEVSRENTIRLVQYLESQGLYNDRAAKIAFSGSKGFHVHIHTEHDFSPAELKRFCMYIAKQVEFKRESGFKIDPQVYNTNRIYRIANTPHEKTGLYKVEMLSTDLLNFSMEEIRAAAAAPQPIYAYEAAISEALVLEVLARIPKPKVVAEDAAVPVVTGELPPCLAKLQDGDMKDGESNAGLLRLANHYRRAGLSKPECKIKLAQAAENRALKYPSANPITEDKLKYEILRPIYSGEGYTFSCSDSFLQEKCERACKVMSTPIPSKTIVFRSAAPAEVPVVDTPTPPVRSASFRSALPDLDVSEKAKLMGFKSLEDTAKGFDEFAKDSKRYRVETGIEAFDKAVRILPNGLTIINARAGVGKTSLIMNMAANVAAKGSKGLIYQIDMAEDEFYTKQASKALGVSPDDILDLFYSDDPKDLPLKNKAHEMVKEAMKGIRISYETDLTVDKIEEDIKNLAAAGEKPSVVFIDYLQKLRGGSDYHRNTENLLKLKSIIARYKVCIVGLSQVPGGQGGNEETPIQSARAAQGGAIFEQNASICINLWRPMKFAGPDKDRIMAFAVSKNRMGECYEGMLYFDGAISELRDATAVEMMDMEAGLQAYNELKAAKSKGRGKFRD